MTPLTIDMATVYAKVSFCLSTSFKPFKIVLSSGPIDPLDLSDLNENYVN